MENVSHFERSVDDGEFISQVVESSELNNVGFAFVPKSFGDEFLLTSDQVIDIHMM